MVESSCKDDTMDDSTFHFTLVVESLKRKRLIIGLCIMKGSLTLMV